MPSRHDLAQDQHLADLDSEARDLRKRIAANVRLINRIAKDLNARLDALAPQSGQTDQVATPKPSRRKPPAKKGTTK